MSRDLDDEQIADLAHRTRSERDPDRTREAARFGDRTIVAQWPCRRCTMRMVPVNSTTVDALETNNRLLVKQGQRPIAQSQVVFCAECEPVARRERAEREARDRAEIRELERELFSLVDNDLREQSIARRLRELGHANVPALISQAAARRAEKRRAATTNSNLNPKLRSKL